MHTGLYTRLRGGAAAAVAPVLIVEETARGAHHLHVLLRVADGSWLFETAPLVSSAQLAAESHRIVGG